MALSGALALLAAPAAGSAQLLEAARWASDQPRGMWIIDVLPGPKSTGCSPTICQAGLNLSPLLVGIRYTNTSSGRRVVMTASVRKCRRAVERSMVLDERDRASWQSRYEQLFDEMMSTLRNACAGTIPNPVTPIALGMLILGEDR